MGKPKSAQEPGLLEGLRVLEIGQRIAASTAGMILAEQGADVIRVVDPALPLQDPVQDALLARGKTEVVLDTGSESGRAALLALARGADVIIENRAAGTMAALGLDFDALRAGDNPRLISCSIPAFAPGDPREALPDYEALASTAGYLYSKPIGAPWVHDFPLGSVLAGLFSACGVMGALIARARTGRGQHVSASVIHSCLFAQVVLILMKTGIPRGFVPLKMVGTPFMGSWQCADDRYVYLHISLPAHNRRIMEMLEENGYGEDVARLREVLSEETMRDPSQVGSIAEARRIRVIYERIFRSRPAGDWEVLLGQELCCIKVRTVQEWLPATIEAGMADACSIDDPVFGEMTAPGAAITAQESPPLLAARETGTAQEVVSRWQQARRGSAAHAPPPRRALEPDLRHPLEGMRVADLSRVIAGPCAARILAELGADVLSIQSPSRLDWALSFHLLFNAGKRSVTLDFSDEEGKRKLWAVLDDFAPDAFIQNYRHIQLADEIGIGPAAVREHFPKIAYTHLNAYGNLGIWRDRPGFEQVVQAVSGIQMTYGRGGKPKLLPTPVIDIGSGLLGAFATLLGLYEQVRNGRSVFCTTHLTRMAVLFQVGPIADHQRARCLKSAKKAGHDVRWDPERRVVGRILRARDGYFCVSGPRADVERWLSAAGIGVGSGAESEAGVSRKVMLRSIACWERSVARLGFAGTVVVVAVPSPGTMLQDLPRTDPSPDPALNRRDFPGVPGSQLTFVRNPLRLSGTPAAFVDPSPMRGQHTAEVLSRIGLEPQGDPVIPYPTAKPLLVWAGTLVRWGWFAWRSGNI